jgi:hypothetical protein
VAIGHPRAWALVERRCFAHESRLPQILVRPHGAGFAPGYPSSASSRFHEPPDAEPHIRLVWEDGGSNPASYPITLFTGQRCLEQWWESR